MTYDRRCASGGPSPRGPSPRRWRSARAHRDDVVCAGARSERSCRNILRVLPWRLLDSVKVDEKNELSLLQRGDEFSIRVGNIELMNSRTHKSEEKLAELGCEAIGPRRNARVLIGGLGMGYTVASALRLLGPEAKIVVAEIFPQVVTWNRTLLSQLAGNPLGDLRVEIVEADVMQIINEAKSAYDLFLLDVDNGPAALTLASNHRIYSPAGVTRISAALREEGVLAIWGEASSPRFSALLEHTGFSVREVSVRGAGKKGPRYVVWIATRQRTKPPRHSSGRTGGPKRAV